MQNDSGYGMDWKDALAYCEELTSAGHSDWRLPNAKELQSIVDYTHMPDAIESTTPSTDGVAIFFPGYLVNQQIAITIKKVALPN